MLEGHRNIKCNMINPLDGTRIIDVILHDLNPYNFDVKSVKLCSTIIV